MKILLPNHFPLQGSGSGIYVLNLAQELLKAGHEPYVIVPDHKPVEGLPFPVKTILFADDTGSTAGLDFNFPCFTTHPRSNTTFYELSDEQMQSYIDAWRVAIDEVVTEFKPDIIHAHHVWITSFVASTFSDIPYVVSCHGTDLMGFENDERYTKLALTAAKKAKAVIAISRQIQGRIVECYGIPVDKAPLIWNGFDKDIFRVIPEVDRNEVLSELGLTPFSEPIISFVGKFTDFKGIDVLLKAAARYEKELPGVRTLLAGQGALWDDLHALCEEQNLKGVHFLGHQSQALLAKLYNIASVSIVPSRIEPFGLVAVEALACGTPVVATDAGGLPDFINDTIGALVPVGDEEALASAIINEVSTNTKQTKGQTAAAYALEGFSWETQVGHMIDLYRNVL
ncbi:glycosyltransferase [Oligoflexia bacterium]|nr:glycosyltransferase [Oligoflexia bacterium]